MGIGYLLWILTIFIILNESHQSILIQVNSAQNRRPQSVNPEIDLSQIGHISSKGRIQDREYNQLPIVKQLLKREKHAIPYLISKLTDETRLRAGTLDFWHKVTVGDIALIILTDLFTHSSWEKTTIPGVAWDEILERKNYALTSEEVLRDFISKHGRQAIKTKWLRIWNSYKERLYWDEAERCFKAKQ
jgi:hypothetical protein